MPEMKQWCWSWAELCEVIALTTEQYFDSFVKHHKWLETGLPLVEPVQVFSTFLFDFLPHAIKSGKAPAVCSRQI